jgi:formate-dependent nitrite reductase membrane component NrfD
MATMQVHEWMINYTRQTEWIDRRGLFLWLAFYAGGLGGGLYLVSLYFNSLWGMFIAWVVVGGIKGTAHLIFLGRPLRAWRIVFRPQSSWLSRGILFVLAFALFGAVQMVLTRWAPGSAAEIVFKVLAGAAAFAVAIYTGFVLNSVKAVPFWNSVLLPILFILCGVMGGLGLSVVIALNGGNVDMAQAEAGTRWLLIVNAFLIGIYLWMAANREATGKKSVLEQIRGHLAPFFWIGIVFLGIIVPLGVALLSHVAAGASTPLILTGVVCDIIGGLTLRYCVLKAGAYQPLVARPR